MKRRALTCVAAAACALLLASAAQSAPSVTKWFEFELHGGHIVVPVKVAGVDTHALLDTGASVHMLNREFAEAHGIAFSSSAGLEVQAGHSRERVPTARNLPIELFGAGVELKLVAVFDVPFADLVIGTGVLRSFVMQIDYANSRIRFLSHDAVDLAQSKNLEMKKSGFNGSPAVRATLDGEDVWLMLDTGYQGPLILNSSFAPARGWAEAEGTLSLDALGAVRGMDRRRVPLLQLGPYDLRGVVAELPSEGRLPPALLASGAGRVSLAGILGAGVLRHFVVTIDLKHTKGHIAPSERIATDSWESSVSADPPALEEVGASP